MPILNNDGLDDALIFDGDSNFNGGMVSFVKPNLLSPGQFSELVNIETDNSGRGITRLGTDSLGTAPDAEHVRGLFFYDWTTDYLIRVSDGLLHKWDGSNWSTISGFTPSDSFNVEMCQLSGNLFLTNGTNIYVWNGSGSAAVVSDADAPACRFLVTHAGRVFAGGLTAVDDIHWSAILDGAGATAWDPGQSFSVGGGDGQGVTGMLSWQNFRLLVFKRNSIYAVNTDPTSGSAKSDWSVETVSRRIGCVNHRTIQQVGNDVFFLSEDGVRSVSRTLADQQVGVSVPVSEPISDIIRRINWAFVDTACSSYYKNLYKLSVPVDSATTPNYVIVWNQITQSWSGYWTGWNATCFAITRFNGLSKEVFGQADGKTLEWLGWKNELDASANDYTDDGTAYASSATSRGYTFGDYLSPKTGYSFEVEFYSSSANGAVSIIPDRGSARQGFSGSTSQTILTLPLDLPFLLPAKGSYRIARDLGRFGQFFSLQCKVATTSGKIAIQGFGLSAFLDSIREES